MSAPVIMALLVLGPLCWLLGGYRWKWVRKYVWAGIAGICVWLSSISLLTALGVALAVGVTSSLPYGDRTPGFLRPLVFASYGLPAVAIAPSVASAVLFPLVSGGLLIALFMASRRWNFITFKLWEGAAGFIQASTLVIACLIR